MTSDGFKRKESNFTLLKKIKTKVKKQSAEGH